MTTTKTRRHYLRWVLNEPPAGEPGSGPVDGEDWLAATRRDLPGGIELEWKREKAWPVERSTVGLARDLAWAALADWRLLALSSDVRLCVSELMTNVVRHANWPEDVVCQSCTVTLRLRFLPLSFLVVEVDDGDPRPPRIPPAASAVPDGDVVDVDAVGTSGRGLWLVGAFSDGVDWHPWVMGGGKTVRCWWDLAARGLAGPYGFRPGP